MKRTCTTTECDRKAHARGLCATHYARQYKAKNYTLDPSECAYCGVAFRRYSISRSECCSNACAQRYRFGWSRSTELVPVPRSRLGQVAAKIERTRRWYGCACMICGESFIAKGFHATCSTPCSEALRSQRNREHKVRYKLARGRFAIADTARLAIYERDGWTCQICGTPTSRTYTHGDHRSPTLDHITPQSWQAVPDHSPSNLRLACALCNALRGDRPLPDEQVAIRSAQEATHGMVHQ